MLYDLYGARRCAEAASGLAHLLGRHGRLRIGAQAVLGLAPAVPAIMGAAGIMHPLMLYSSAAGIVGLVAIEAAASS